MVDSGGVTVVVTLVVTLVVTVVGTVWMIAMVVLLV